MSDNDKKIESLLKRYHPRGPSAELKARVFTPQPKRRMRIWLPAASIFLLIGLGLTYQTLTHSNIPDAEPMTRAQLEKAVQRAGYAAKLLASADIIAAQPGGRSYAQGVYREITEQYPDLPTAAQARLRLKGTNERSTTQ